MPRKWFIGVKLTNPKGVHKMKLLKNGKTKNVYALENGNYLLKLKDDATVNEDGNIDPGGNTVGASIEGLGKTSLRMTKYYFEKINAAGILTHYIKSDLEDTTMTVLPASQFGGKNGIEVICRLKAVGSFLRRYGDYCTEGQNLDYFVEVSLKDDERGDPMISKEALNLLGILNYDEYDDLVARTRQIVKIIHDDLADKGLTLYDIKLEFGKIDGKVALIDEFSGGVMRVYKDSEWIKPLELGEYY